MRRSTRPSRRFVNCPRACALSICLIIAIFVADEIRHRSIIQPGMDQDIKIAAKPRLYMCRDSENMGKSTDFHERLCSVTPTIATIFSDYLNVQDIMEQTGRLELAKDFGGAFGRGFAMCSPPDYLLVDVAASRGFPPVQLALARPHDVAIIYGVFSSYCSKLMANFPGKVLFMNTEAYDLHPDEYANVKANPSLAFDAIPQSPNMFVLGPHPYVPHIAMQLPAISFIYHTHYAQKYDLRRISRRRPKNDGRHFLIYAQHHYIEYREKAFNELATIGEVHTAGPCEGNWQSKPDGWRSEELALFSGDCVPFAEDLRPPNIVPSPYQKELTEEKIAWHTNQENGFQHYRFILCMESYVRGGYVTEKILVAFLAGAIPIYYGDSTSVFDIFNRDAFIFYDVSDPQPALAQIRQLEVNKNEYKKMLKQPMLADGERTIEKYFSFDGSLRTRIRDMMGLA